MRVMALTCPAVEGLEGVEGEELEGVDGVEGETVAPGGSAVGVSTFIASGARRAPPTALPAVHHHFS
jgi:hypothetical protein